MTPEGKNKIRVLSGTRPTSQLHLGNLLGALQNWKKYEGDQPFFMIADWHALTTEYEAKESIRNNVFEVALDYLASGLDPNKSTIFVQSWVRQHAELSLLLSMVTPLAWLERNPTYKDQIKELKDRELHTHGFLGYPVLQAADILLYQADIVPVGEDQLPHLELAREIARRFNHLYGKKVFKEPKSSLSRVPKLPGVDGRKMSKSYGNAIYLSDGPSVVDQKVMQMVTDPARKRRSDKGHPDVCPVYFYHKLFNKENESVVAKECKAAERGCVECKKEMAGRLKSFMAPMYEKRCELQKNKEHVRQVLVEGSKTAAQIAEVTLQSAKEAAGL